MPSYETRTQYPILAAFADAELWTAETTATERDVFAGPATASVGSAMRLVGSGTPTTNTAAIDVKIERGGYPDGSATFQQRVSGAADFASWDAPTEVGYIEPVSWSTSETQSLWSMSSATLPDGRVVLVAEYYSSGTSTIKIRVRSTAGAWSSSATANSSVQAFYRHPQVVATGDGYVRIYFLNHNSKFETTQIAMIEASEDATSATLADFSAFTTTQSDLLKSPIPKVGAFYASFLQIAAGGGQVMAIVTQNDTLYQAASNDGITFTGLSVTISNVRDRASLAYIAGAFILAYGDVTSGDLKVRTVASASSTLGDADVITVEGTVYTSGDTDRLVLVRGYDETAWLYSMSDAPATTTGSAIVHYSTDAGLTWSPAAMWRNGRTITAASGCWWRDRALIFVGANTDLLTYEDSITCLHLGGWTELPMARRAASTREIGARVAMNVAWVPTDHLNHTFTVTTTGSTIEAFGSTAYYQVDVASGASSYQAKVLSGAPYPALARLACRVTAGTLDLVVHVDDNTNQYAIKVTITPTGFTVHDVGAGTTAATVTFASSAIPHEIFVWADSNKATVWYRDWALDHPTEWTHVVDETLSSGIFSPLTKTDDTNVTLTLGGSPTTALLAATSLTLGWSGTLAVGRGGLGISTTPSNGFVPIGNGTNYTAAALTAGTGITITNASGAITIAATAGGGSAPITKTANFTVGVGESWYINNKTGSACTVTLPTASSYTGRELTFVNYQAQTLISASSNVVPLGGGSAGTAILAASVGDWATLVSDGTNWIIMQAAANNCLLLE